MQYTQIQGSHVLLSGSALGTLPSFSMPISSYKDLTKYNDQSEIWYYSSACRNNETARRVFFPFGLVKL